MATVSASINVTDAPDKVEMRLRQKSAFAVQHMMAAARFSRTCGEIEFANREKPLGEFFDLQIASVSATIMLAVASLESNINEYLSEPETTLPGLPGESSHSLVQPLERKSILEKYQYVLSFRGKEIYRSGEPPYQDVDALVKLRNALVHFKPEWHDEQDLHRKLESRLKGRFEINPAIDDNGVFFPQKCMSYGCTKWAVFSALEFMRDFSVRADLPFRFEKFAARINPKVE